MANRVLLNCRKISKSVTCSVTGMKFSSTRRGSNGRSMIVVDDYAYDYDDGVTTTAGQKEVLSDSEKGGGEGAGGLEMTSIDCVYEFSFFFFFFLFLGHFSHFSLLLYRYGKGIITKQSKEYESYIYLPPDSDLLQS
jgi:hypothetical protein